MGNSKWLGDCTIKNTNHPVSWPCTWTALGKNLLPLICFQIQRPKVLRKISQGIRKAPSLWSLHPRYVVQFNIAPSKLKKFLHLELLMAERAQMLVTTREFWIKIMWWVSLFLSWFKIENTSEICTYIASDKGVCLMPRKHPQKGNEKNYIIILSFVPCNDENVLGLVKWIPHLKHQRSESVNLIHWNSI